MAEPYGTIAKYRNALAIKKHNTLIQPWASAMALDVAAVFWATWKGIEERLPKGDEVIEAEKPRDSRDLKNKYSAIIRIEVKRHSAEMQRVVENYIYRVWLAGAVEQCRDLGCSGWFLSSLSKSSTSSESASAPDGTSLQESEILFIGKMHDRQIGVYVDNDGKAKYVAYDGEIYNKFSPTSGLGTPFKDGEIDKKAKKGYTVDYKSTEIKPKKLGGEGLPYKSAKAAYSAKSAGAKTTSSSKSGSKTTKAKTTSTSKSVPKTPSVAVKADKSGWVSLPNLRAQTYAKKHAAEAVTNINDTTRKEMARIVSDGVKSGSSYSDIAKSIKSKFEEFAVPMPQKHIANRAVLVAVTELANAYCEGNNQVGQYLQDNGVQMMKAWQTLEDNRVSDGCQKNEHAGWIPFKDKFPSGHVHPPRFPGCRCDFLIEMSDEKFLGKSIDAFYSAPIKKEAPAKSKVSKKATPSSKIPTKTKKTSAVASKTKNEKSAKTSIPNWEKWDAVEKAFYDVTSDNADPMVVDSFSSGKGAARRRIKNKKALTLLDSKDISFYNMSKRDLSCLKRYTTQYYSTINEYLRSGYAESYELDEVNDTISGIRSAISKNGVLREDIVTTRLFDGKYWDEWKEGETRKLPEFLSTTVSDYREGMGTFGSENVAHIYVPANKGAGIYIDGESNSPGEFEYLIQAGSKFKVHHIDRTGATNHYYLELIV